MLPSQAMRVLPHDCSLDFARLWELLVGARSHPVLCFPCSTEKIQQEILHIREKMNEVTYRFQMPIPLAYYHLITVLTAIVSMLYTYCTAANKTASPTVAWAGWAVVMFGFLGMREVSMQVRTD